MTPEAQRIAIAEACGWQRHPKDKWIVIPPNSPHSVQPLHTLPDYLSDLNAMHAAEKAAFDGSQILWQRYLDDVLPTVVAERNAVECATAAQRAEAFLRTLGKFTE